MRVIKVILGIYGSGGLGREIYELARRCETSSCNNTSKQRWDDIIFIDDYNDEGPFFGTKRIKFGTLLENKDDYECIVAIGEPSSREGLFNKLTSKNIKIATIIDPSSFVSPTATIKEGVIICEFTTIHANVDIANNVLIQPFCDIGHDIKIGNHSVISPFCAPGGGIVIGERVYIGMKSALMEKITIGDDVIVGMGSTVFRDVPDGATVVGNPARITKGNDEHRVFNSR